MVLKKFTIGLMVASVMMAGCQAGIAGDTTATSQTSLPEANSVSSAPDVSKKVMQTTFAYLQKTYEKNGQQWLKFSDEEGQVKSLPMAKDVKVTLPNYYPENQLSKLVADLKNPNNKNIKGIFYTLTIDKDKSEIQAIERPKIKPDVAIEFKPETDPVLKKAVEEYLDNWVDAITKKGLPDPSKIKFYKTFSSYIVLGRNVDGDNIDYYIWSQQDQFELQDGKVVDGMSGSIPGAMQIKKTNNGYQVVAYSEAADGDWWAPSLQRMYPLNIAEKLGREYGTKNYFPNDIDAQLQAQAETYFKNMDKK